MEISIYNLYQRLEDIRLAVEDSVTEGRAIDAMAVMVSLNLALRCVKEPAPD